MVDCQGISVSTWVDLDSSCRVEPKVFEEQLQLEFGTRTGTLGMMITEDMVDRLSVVFAEAKARIRELAGQDEQEVMTV